MRKIRLGKDISVTWRVTINGKAESLSAYDLVLTLWGGGMNPRMVDFSVTEPNVIAFAWDGSDQKFPGLYYLSLYKKDSPRSIVDVPFVELVERSWDEECSSPSDMQTECVSLIPGDMTINGDYNVLIHKPRINGVELVGDVEIHGGVSDVKVNGASVVGEDGVARIEMSSDFYTRGETDRFLEGKQDTLVSGSTIKTVNSQPLLGGGNIEIHGGVSDVKVDGMSVVEDGIANIELPNHSYLSLERLRPYLYRVTFDSLPEDNGGDSPVSGGCSSYVRDGRLYRNLDFNYDNSASFIVRTKDFVGMSFITGLDDGSLDETLISQLPYRVVDGCNGNGIKVSTHVLYNDWEWTGAGSRTISLTRLPFLVLSRVRSMATIADDLDGVLDNLYASAGLLATGYLIQVLVTDGTTTYAILPPTSEGQAFVLQNITSNPKLANFRWVSRATVARTDNDMQKRPTGIERWNTMPCELSDLRFTKAYEQPDRLSEFIGLRNTTKVSTDEELTAIYNDAHALYLDRSRDGRTWHTMHSVEYSGSRMVQLYIQEDWNNDCTGGQSEEDTNRLIMDNLAVIQDIDDLFN